MRIADLIGGFYIVMGIVLFLMEFVRWRSGSIIIYFIGVIAILGGVAIIQINP